MSKFKVGDKVKNGRYEGIITDIKTKTTYTMSTEREGTYSNLSDKDLKLLKPYKTPHQELLDLGWKVLDDRNNIMLYHLLVDGKFYYQIKIDNIIKSIDLSYEDVSGYRTTTQLDLKLTSILKRYLEELE